MFFRLEARVAKLEEANADLDARLSASEQIGGQERRPSNVTTLAQVVNATCRAMRVSTADVRGSSTDIGAVTARVAAAWIADQHLKLGATVIGRGLGGRSGGDVTGMVRRAELRRMNDADLRDLTDGILRDATGA